MILGLAIYLLSIFSGMKDTINAQMYQPIPSINQIQSEEKIAHGELINILFIGVNTKASNRTGSDTLIIFSLDPKTDSVSMINIPRHTRASLGSEEKEDKINRAFTYGGADLAVESIKSLLDIEIDYYIQLDLAGIAELIDGIGGLTIHNELSIEADNFQVSPGELHLSGAKALRYVEMLYQYQGEDLDQAELQQQVFETIMTKLTTSLTINKVEVIASFLGENIITNIDYDNVEQLVRNYSSVGGNISDYTLDGTEEIIDDEYYFIVPDSEIKKVQQLIVNPDTEI